MEEVLSIALPVVVKYAPELISDIKAALQKEAYTVEQVDEIFSSLKPYEFFGVNPNAPVKPE
jgi:Txe/YoeB family toxin of Txe-Axe toxin-antitoxin module